MDRELGTRVSLRQLTVEQLEQRLNDSWDALFTSCKVEAFHNYPPNFSANANYMQLQITLAIRSRDDAEVARLNLVLDDLRTLEADITGVDPRLMRR